MKRPSRHKGAPKTEVTSATLMHAAGLYPAVGCGQSPEAGWGAPGNVCQAQGRSGQPLSSGCRLPAASLRTVRGDRLGWMRGPPSTSLTDGARPCVSESPWPESGAQPPGAGAHRQETTPQLRKLFLQLPALVPLSPLPPPT